MKSSGRRANLAPDLLPTGSPCNVTPRRCPVAPERAEHRILILLTGANGDILMSTPLLTALRDAYPTAHITWIAEHTALDAIDTNPLLDTVIRWDGSYFRRPLRQGNLPLLALRSLKAGRLLQQGRFDIFISFEPEKWLPIILLLRHRTQMIGIFDRWYSREPKPRRNRQFFRHAFFLQDLPVHRSDQALLPLSTLNLPPLRDRRMTMGYRIEDRDAAWEFLQMHGISVGERYVVVAPMTTWESRCWSGARYAEVCDRLYREHNCRVVLIGSDSERSAIDVVRALAEEPHIVAAGAFGFRVMAALIGGAALLLSGDTGPMHVAGAIGTPYLALFGSTEANGRAPLAGRGLSLSHPVPCGPCDRILCTNPPETHMLCMKLITVDEVMHAATALLRGNGDTKP